MRAIFPSRSATSTKYNLYNFKTSGETGTAPTLRKWDPRTCVRDELGYLIRDGARAIRVITVGPGCRVIKTIPCSLAFYYLLCFCSVFFFFSFLILLVSRFPMYAIFLCLISLFLWRHGYKWGTSRPWEISSILRLLPARDRF